MATVWLAGGATAMLWIFRTDVPGWRQGLALLALLVAGCWAGWTWQRTPSAALRWDTQTWTWLPDNGAGTVTGGGSLTVSLDLQRVFLLRWQGDLADRRQVRWLWLERSSCPARWDDLRRAVYSRATPDPLPQAKPPAGNP